MMLGTVVTLSLLALTVYGAHDLSQEYRFSAILDRDGLYELHWNYDLSAQTISFAVRVQTTGWVGFGISPDGGMVGSDVVIGWVESEGTVQFHVSNYHQCERGSVSMLYNCYCLFSLFLLIQDRYAEQEALPPIDASQDWFLISGEQENGFTILEFSRNITSCDDRDMNILVSDCIYVPRIRSRAVLGLRCAK